MVHSFEPHPQTYRKLKKEVNSPNFLAHQLALGSEPGKKELYDYGSANLTINSLVNNAPYVVRFSKHQASHPFEVEVDRLDRFCDKNNVREIDILKTDTEGFDVQVLKGGIGLLSNRAVKFIYFEFNSISGLEGTSGTSLLEADGLLKRFGYTFVSSYVDYVITEGEFFAVRNGLYFNQSSAHK